LECREEIRRPPNLDVPEGVEPKEMGVSRNNDIRPCSDRAP